MSFLARIDECNAHDLTNFLPFFVEEVRVGWVKSVTARRLRGFPEVFDVASDSVYLDSALETPDARTAAMARVVAVLAEEGIVTDVRDELYRVNRRFTEPPLLAIERAAAPLFGIRAYGVHMTGYVRKDDGIYIWVGQRAPDRAVAPDHLDNMVAGGQPVGLGLKENLIKECGEEASIPPDIAQSAVPVGTVSYVMETPDGLKPDVLFCYDLELPADFEPRNTDGEIAEFFLWPVDKVMHIIANTREFKFNCNLVNIDFFVRHGLIDPDDPDYVAIVRGLHR